ncbi:MAG: hypothetical protein EAZ44_08455 [Cytophagia bacterium]|nr:MAG: hypothetical protein EAZ44_08455 [Cytophagia bacterium]
MKKLKIFAIILLLIIASCKKKNQDAEPTLPPETQTGADTFGCILNGQVWTNSPRGQGTLPPLECTPEGNGVLTIIARYSTPEKWEDLKFYSINVYGNGQYPIKKSLRNVAGFFSKTVDMWSQDSDVSEDGLLTITRFDMSNRVIAGTFWFKLQKTGGTTIEAKNGRFDITMN